MSDDLSSNQGGQNNSQFDDIAHQQGQGTTQPAVPGEGQQLNQDNDRGTEAVTGSAPQAGADDETTDNAGTDNFAPARESHVEEVEFDPSTKPAGASEPTKSDIDLDEDDEDEGEGEGEDEEGDDTEDADGDGI
jgi:hypothetical protein